MESTVPFAPTDPDAIRENVLYRWESFVVNAVGMVSEDAANTKDSGTCVLGAGIAVNVLPARCRVPRRRILVPAPFQGNVASYEASKRAILALRAAGLDAYWYDGTMD
jgi:hypothetical protein